MTALTPQTVGRIISSMRWRGGKGNEPAWAAAEVRDPEHDYRRRRQPSDRTVNVARVALLALILLGSGVIAWQLIAALAS